MALSQHAASPESEPEDNRRRSARERAEQKWGMGDTGNSGSERDDSDNSSPESANSPDEGSQPALDRASDRWGQAGVVPGGDNQPSGRVYDRPGNARDHDKLGGKTSLPGTSGSKKAAGAGGTGGVAGVVSKIGKKEGKDSKEDSKDSNPASSAVGAASSAANLATSIAGGAGGIGKLAGFLKTNKGKKGGIAGLIIGLALMLAAVFFGPSIGPLEWIHFAQNMHLFHFSDQDEMSKSRFGKFIKYHYYKHDKSKTRLSYIENKIGNKIDTGLGNNGFKLKVDPATGLFKGFEYDPANSKDGTLKDLDGLPEDQVKQRLSQELGVDINKITVSGGTYTIPNDGLKRVSNGRLIGRVYASSIDRGRIWSAYQKRLLIKKVGLTFDPITKLKRQAGQSTVDAIRNIKEQRKARLTGSEPPADVKAVGSNDNKGNPDPNSQTAADSGNQLADSAKTGKLKVGAVSGIAGVSFLCVAKSIADESSIVNKINLYKVAINAGDEVLSVAAKAQDGKDIDMSVLADAYSQSLYSKQNGDWHEAHSFRGEFGDYNGKMLPKELDPTQAQNVVSRLLSGIPGLSGVCSVLNNTVVSIVMSVIDGPVAILAQGFFMSPAGQALFNQVVGLFVRDVPDLSSATYAGSPYGEAANLGGRLIANEASLSMGGRVLDDGEESKLASATNQEVHSEYADESAFDKYLNPQLATSTVGQMVDQLNPSSPYTLVASTIGMTLRMPGSIVDKLIPHAWAAPTETKRQLYYGVSKVGFTPDAEAAVENPFSNADEVADLIKGPDGQHYTDLLQKCNNIQVIDGAHGLDFIPGEGMTSDYDGIDGECKNDNDQNFAKLRMAAYDTLNAKSVACVDFDDEESCNDIGVPGGSGIGSSDSPTGGGAWQWPVHKEDANGLGQCWLHAYNGGYHAAIDISVTYKPVYAAHNGTIVAKLHDGYNTFIIDTGTDPTTNKTLYAVYEHMSAFDNGMDVGKPVTAGQRIGISGATSPTSIAPHLHFGISDSKTLFGFYSNPWHTANPLDYLPNDYDPALLKDGGRSCLTKDIINQPDFGFNLYKSQGTFDAYKK
jgi:hypothetical protein